VYLTPYGENILFSAPGSIPATSYTEPCRNSHVVSLSVSISVTEKESHKFMPNAKYGSSGIHTAVQRLHPFNETTSKD
jgi:hypothetical protein